MLRVFALVLAVLTAPVWAAGADGVILYAKAGDGVRMRLINADGSDAQLLVAETSQGDWQPIRAGS